MNPIARILVVLFVVSVLAPARVVDARGHHRRHHPQASSKAGKFDYYVLSLSWSPEHCAEKPGPPDDSQCGTERHYAFIVHGLWPQYENGGYPQACSTRNRLSADVIEHTLDIMPSEQLIQHEWQKHGTCSGLSADAYFLRAREAFQHIAIPDRYSHPDSAFQVTADNVREDFKTANAALPSDGLAVLCNGHFFTELRICLPKEGLEPRQCGAKVRDSCRGKVTVRPVR